MSRVNISITKLHGVRSEMNDLRRPRNLNFESTNLSEAKWKRSMQYYRIETSQDRGEDEKVTRSANRDKYQSYIRI